MKKLLLTLVVLSTLLLGACGKKAEEATPAATTTEVTAPATTEAAPATTTEAPATTETAPAATTEAPATTTAK